TIEQTLLNVPRTQPYFDDNMITGENDEDHLKNLRTCLQRFRHAGVRLHAKKCEFMKPEIEHLGHVLNESGVLPGKKKAEAIVNAPAPADLQALESWLCTAQYYADFIPHFSSIAGPLNELRRKGVEFKWTETQQK